MTYRFNLLKRKVRSTKTQCQLTAGGGNLGIVPQKINRLIKARVKRCGKSTPAKLVTASAWKTPLGARLSRDDIVRNN